MMRLVLCLFGLVLARTALAKTPRNTCFAQLERPLSLINVIIGANCQLPQNPTGIHLHPFARFVLKPTPVAHLREAPTADEVERFAHASEKMHAYFCVPVSRHRGRTEHFVHRNRFTKVVGDLKIDLLDLLTETINHLDPHVFKDAINLAERDQRLDLFLAHPSPARLKIWTIADFLIDYFDSRIVRDLSAQYRHDLREAMKSGDRRRLTFELSDQLSLRLQKLLRELAVHSKNADVRELAPVITGLMGVEKVTHVPR